MFRFFAVSLVLMAWYLTAPQEPAYPVAEGTPTASTLLIEAQNNPQAAYRTLDQILTRKGYSAQNRAKVFKVLAAEYKKRRGASLPVSGFGSSWNSSALSELRGTLPEGVQMWDAHRAPSPAHDFTESVNIYGVEAPPQSDLWDDLLGALSTYPPF